MEWRPELFRQLFIHSSYYSFHCSTSDGWQLTTFKQTPKMSSYLLAIVVGDLSKTETTNSNGVLVCIPLPSLSFPSFSPSQVRVWARHETVEDTRYALEAGAKVLAQYDEYFGIKFPLEKMGEQRFE